MGLHLHLHLRLRLHLRQPSMACLYLFITHIILVSHVPIPVSAESEEYKNCSALFRCGDIDNIGFPFWGENRPEYCGHPEFKLDCREDAPEMKINGITYKVRKINNASREVTVARDDYWDNLCPSDFVNTSLNSDLFSYTSGTENLTLYYSCPNDFMYEVSRTTLSPFQFPPCSQDEANNYFSWDTNTFNMTTMDAITAYLGRCGERVEVPAQKSILESMVSNPGSANLTRLLQGGFGLEWLPNDRLCDGCEKSGGQCGYAARTAEFTCYSSGKGSKFSTGARKIGIAAGAAGIIGIMITLLIVGLRRVRKNKILNDPKVFGPRRSQKKNTEKENAEAAFIRNYTSLAPKRYYYSDIIRMTKSFSDLIGQGGYGNVYKGKLHDDRLVAVKVLKDTNGDGEEFINEVASISRTSHVNVVSLLGFCYGKNRRALIFEFMPNGSLDRFIYDEESSHRCRKLEWRTMCEIAVGIARGLEYLHRGCNIRIVHFDIKPHNILLNDDFCPKISDFGLAKQSKNKESAISMLHARGTIGYIAPEVFCRNFGGVSHKADVYSYGMMILEMVVGRKNADVIVSRSSEMYFPNSIYKRIEPGNDFQLNGAVTEEEKEMARKLILVSLWCIQTNPADRPSMHKVLEMLESNAVILQIPPKPSLSLPIKSAHQSSPTSTSTEMASLEESFS